MLYNRLIVCTHKQVEKIKTRKNMRRIGLFALLVAVVGFLFWNLSIIPKTSAAPIVCSGRSYMVRTTDGVNGKPYSQLYELIDNGSTIDLNTILNSPDGLTLGGQNTKDETVFPNGFALNALAYNPVDGYVYAAHIDTSGASPSNDIYRIHADGHLELAATVNFTTNSNLKGAAFSPSGVYYGFSNVGPNTYMYSVSGLDAAPSTPATVSGELQLSQYVQMGDVFYDHTNSTLYAMDNDTARLYTVNSTTGVTTAVAGSVSLGSGVSLGVNGIGSMFSTVNGQLMAYINNDASGTVGILVSVNKTTNQLTLIKNGPTTFNSDGTSCVPVNNRIDTIKSATSVNAVNSTTFDVQYSIGVKNTSGVADPNIQLVDNLSQTFASGAPTITVPSLSVVAGTCTKNNAYNGTSDIRLLSGSDTLNAGASCTLSLTVRLVYGSVGAVPSAQQLNTVLASTTATGPNDGHTYSGSNPVEPFNALATDTSTDGANYPGTPNTDTPTPTPVLLAYYVVDVVKTVGSVTTVNDVTYSIPYTLVIGNSAGVTLPNVQVSDNLSNTFANGAPVIEVTSKSIKSGPCTINNSFNGTSVFGLLSGTDSLTSGQSCTVSLVVKVTYPSRESVPQTDQNNIAYASSVATGPNAGYTYGVSGPQQPANALTFDSSTDATALPSSAHGDTSSPTPVRFSLAQTGISSFQVLLLGAAILVVGAGITQFAHLRRFVARI